MLLFTQKSWTLRDVSLFLIKVHVEFNALLINVYAVNKNKDSAKFLDV